MLQHKATYGNIAFIASVFKGVTGMELGTQVI